MGNAFIYSPQRIFKHLVYLIICSSQLLEEKFYFLPNEVPFIVHSDDIDAVNRYLLFCPKSKFHLKIDPHVKGMI